MKTFNLALDVRNGQRTYDPLYDDVTAFLKGPTIGGEVLVAEEAWFGGKYGGDRIFGLGFTVEADRLLFLLTFIDRDPYLQATEKDFDWGYNPDVDW